MLEGRSGQAHTLGLRHIPMVFAAPRSLFGRVEDTGSYGWALVTILVSVMLLGYLEVQTGLIDRTVDQQTEAALAKLEESQAHLVDRVELREQMDDVRKGGEFNKLLHVLGAIAMAPAFMLASFLLIAAVLFAAVALTGRKPEYHTLMSICVFAGFIELAGQTLRLGMVFAYRTIDVNTSLGMLAPPGVPSVLVAVDPFRIWFWVLVALGLITTRQLGRRGAVVTCVVLALVGAGVRVAASFAGRGG